MAEDRQAELRRQEAEQKEREAQRAKDIEQRALDGAQDGDIVLVRDAVDANKHRVAAGTKLTESEDWPAHRIQFMLQEGHAKMKGAEVKTTEGQARRPAPKK